MNADDFRLLYEYNTWANQRTLDSCAGLTAEQFTRDLRSSFSSVRDSLAHIYGAEWLWLERWHGRIPSALPSASDFADFASLKARWAQHETALHTFVFSLTSTDLERLIKYKNTQGVPFEGPLWPMLQHVVNHSSYHRGQVATLLRQLGAKPIATDLIAFHRERAARVSA